MVPAVPQELVQALAQCDAVLFVGAGLSAGAGLPSWSQLLDPLAEEIGLPSNKRNDLLLVAQFCQNKLGRQRLVQAILEATDTTDKAITENHRRLLKLGSRTWITTNYDDLLEQTLREAGVKVAPVVQDKDLSFASSDRVTLLKLHGDRGHPTSIVITRADYEKIAQTQPLLYSELKSLLAKRTFLFVGYRFGDPDFGLTLAEVGQHLGEYQRTAYAVLFDADEFTSDELARQHIRTIVLETGGQAVHCQLLGEWLDALIARLPSSNVSVNSLPGYELSGESSVQHGWHVLLVSHKSDFQIVDRIAHRIVRDVARVWYEPWNRIPGNRVSETARPPYESAPTCAIFIGPDTPSDWLEDQIQMALDRRDQVSDFRVIPVLLPGSTEEMVVKHELGVPADYRVDEEQALHALVCGIEGKAIGAWQPRMSDRSSRLVEAEGYLRVLRNWQEAGLIPETVAIDGQRQIVRNLIASQSWQRLSNNES